MIIRSADRNAERRILLLCISETPFKRSGLDSDGVEIFHSLLGILGDLVTERVYRGKSFFSPYIMAEADGQYLAVNVLVKIANIGLAVGGVRTGVPSYEMYDVNYEVLPFPSEINGNSYVACGAVGYGMTSSCAKNKKEIAWKFLSYMFSEEGQEEFSKSGAICPVMKSLLTKEDAEWKKYSKVDDTAFYAYPERDIKVTFLQDFEPAEQHTSIYNNYTYMFKDLYKDKYNGKQIHVVFHYENYDCVGLYSSACGHYHISRVSIDYCKSCPIPDNLGDCFNREFDEYHKLLNGAEQKLTYEEFASPVFILNAIARSLESGNEEEVLKITL